jgi:hypothetical protein
MRKSILICLVLALTAGSSRLFAQQDAQKNSNPAAQFYRLLFTVQEVGESGKITNSRVYSTSISNDRNLEFEQIRIGTRVPVKTNDKGEIQYLDIGVNIDCKDAREMDGKLALEVTAQISSLGTETGSSNLTPVVRQNRWQASVLVPIGKPSVIFSSDDLQGKGKVQVELTATRIE